MNKFVSSMSLVSLFVVGCASEPEPAAVSDAVSVDHCVAPWGIDWNQVLGVDDAELVTFFCTTVHRGDVAHGFVPQVSWITNSAGGIPGGPVVYPRGYVPKFAAPIVDFSNKLDTVRYVVHPGELEYSFSGRAISKLVALGDLFAGSGEFPEGEMVRPAISLQGVVPALPPGDYSVDIHFFLSAAHCDGASTDFEKSCLPAGDTKVVTRQLRVVP